LAATAAPLGAADPALVAAATKEGEVVWYTTQIVSHLIGAMPGLMLLMATLLVRGGLGACRPPDVLRPDTNCWQSLANGAVNAIS
jgi:hypothetical protein